MSYILIIVTMLLWGSIGIFVKEIPLSSSQIVLARTIVGSAFLGVVYFFGKKKIEKGLIRKNIVKLLWCGAAMGFNWMMLFEAYNYTSVSIATVTYYCAPAMIILASPIFLKEKLTLPKIIGVTAAMIGMVMVNLADSAGGTSVTGVALGLTAAVLYASVIIVNKKIKGFTGLETAFIELVCAAIIITPYTLVTFKGEWILPDTKALLLLLVVCVIHTGVAFALYFSAIGKLSAQSAAICSFVDPAFALILSAAVLGERLSFIQIIGAVVILAGAAFAEIYKPKDRLRANTLQR